MERDIEKDLIEIECAIKSQKEKDNIFTMSVLQRCYKLVSQLKEYKDLEEQGKLLKLPCAVGDTVYTDCSWGIESGIVGSIEIISDRIFVNNTRGQMIGGARNIFLTREEAEAALKELERGKGE